MEIFTPQNRTAFAVAISSATRLFQFNSLQIFRTLVYGFLKSDMISLVYYLFVFLLRIGLGALPPSSDSKVTKVRACVGKVRTSFSGLFT